MVALKLCVWPGVKVAEVGEMVMLVAVRLMLALADFVGSSTLVAVIVTRAPLVNVPVGGAVYVAEFPFVVSDPTTGVLVIAHVTPFVPPLTVAVKLAVWPAFKLVAEAVTVTPTGASVMLALPVTEVSVLSVAVSLKVWAAVMGFGATYTHVLPLGVTVPGTPVSGLHVTAVWLVPNTCAVNVTDWPGVGVMLEGDTSTLITAGVSAICTVADWVGSY